MPLSISRWTEQVLGDAPEPASWTEGLTTITVAVGWHDDPSGQVEPIIVRQERTVRNQAGTILRRDLEFWDHDVAGGPPRYHYRETWAEVYLPGRSRPNGPRGLHKVEEEETTYYPWTALAGGPGGELTRLRVLKAYVVYTMRQEPTAVTPEISERATARGYVPGVGLLNVVVDSGRMLLDAIRQSGIVETASSPQTTLWTDPVRTEWDITFAEPDKITTYTTTKNHLVTGDCQVSGPTMQRRDSWQYRLGVEIEPPTIRATSLGDAGVRLVVEGGGADVPSRPGQTTRVPPERYRVERRTVLEPEGEASSDPFDLWDSDPPAPVGRGIVFGDTLVEDLEGEVVDPLPPQESYEEPGDPAEPVVEDWQALAELRNEAAWDEPGQARTVDVDVGEAGEYEYRAIALVGSEESAPGQVARVIQPVSGEAGRIVARLRRAADQSVEVDVLAPEDPGLLALEYGETFVCDLPVDLSALVDDLTWGVDESEWPGAEGELAAAGLVEELARRLFSKTREPRLAARVTLTMPLLGLERGQRVALDPIAWQTIGNGLVISSETAPGVWLLDGWTLAVSRAADGQLDLRPPTLTLVEP